MNRRGFVGRLLAALGLGATGLGLATEASGSTLPPEPTPPPCKCWGSGTCPDHAPMVRRQPSVGYLRYYAQRSQMRYGRWPKDFFCTRETLLDVASTVTHVGDYGTLDDVRILGMRWVDSPDMAYGEMLCGRAMRFDVT